MIYGIGKGYIKSNNSSYTGNNPNVFWDGGENYITHLTHSPYYYPHDLYYFYSQGYPQGYMYSEGHQQQGGRM